MSVQIRCTEGSRVDLFRALHSLGYRQSTQGDLTPEALSQHYIWERLYYIVPHEDHTFGGNSDSRGYHRTHEWPQQGLPSEVFEWLNQGKRERS